MTVLITGHALEMTVAILARNIPLVGRMPNVKPVLTGQSAAVPMAGQETLTLNATNMSVKLTEIVLLTRLANPKNVSILA
jgi:hypothetical protein